MSTLWTSIVLSVHAHIIFPPVQQRECSRQFSVLFSWESSWAIASWWAACSCCWPHISPRRASGSCLWHRSRWQTATPTQLLRQTGQQPIAGVAQVTSNIEIRTSYSWCSSLSLFLAVVLWGGRCAYLTLLWPYARIRETCLCRKIRYSSQNNSHINGYAAAGGLVDGLVKLDLEDREPWCQDKLG